MDIIAYFATALSLVGVILNIHKSVWCFRIWAFTNTWWMIYDIYKQAYAQALLFAVYVALAIYGLIKWTPKKGKTNG